MAVSRKIIYIVMALLCMLIMVSCGDRNEAEETAAEHPENADAGYRKTVLYLYSDGGYIVPVMKMIPWEEGIGRAALGHLVGNAENSAAAEAMGLNTLIPEGTEIALRISDEGLATVDLKGLGDCGSMELERAMTEAIVNTLCEFPAINSVAFLLDGEAVAELPHGTRLERGMEVFALNAEDGDVSASADGAEPMTLYFPNASASLNIPVTRYGAGGSGLEAAVRELIEGPGSEGLLNCFPEGTALLGASLDGGVATVDLSAEFLSAGYTDGLAEAAYETMFLTAAELGDVYRLDVLVEGRPSELTASCSAPLYVNEFPSGR